MRESNLNSVNKPLFLQDFVPSTTSYIPPSLEVINTFLEQKQADAALQNIENYLFPSLCDRKTAFDSVNDRVASHSRGQKDGMGIYKWDAESIADFKARASEPYWKYFNWNLPKD